MKLISSTLIQNAYNKLYSKLREYVWEYDVAILIAKLEVASYKAIVDLNEIKLLLNQIEQASRYAEIEDEELFDALNHFKKLAESADYTYLKLEES